VKKSLPRILFIGICLLYSISAWSLSAKTLGIVINTADPDSIRSGEYYRIARGIPAANLIKVRFKPGSDSMSSGEFSTLKAVVDANAPIGIQAYALAWTYPYRVGCMSITTAFAFGYDRAFCARGCKTTRVSPYYNSSTQTPWQTYHMRPAMLLAGKDWTQVRRLINRGLRADGSRPTGTAYLLDTLDKQRNVRASLYPAIQQHFGRDFRVEHIKANAITDRYDILFYFTGMRQVEGLDRIGFRPGAMADHLTSAGGVLDGRHQMSALRWLEAGATGSYGAVTEPCNFIRKFPNPALVMKWYLQGDTLIEAYWKSVAMPGQGVFSGEPLSRPVAG